MSDAVMPDPVSEALRALRCLRLEAPPSVCDDVERRVKKAFAALAASPSVGGWGSSADADTHRAAEGAVVDDRLHDAIRQLRQHMTTIQAAKKASAAGQPQGMGPIWNLVNALPAIVRQLDAAELDIEAAFERYEDAATHHPSRKDRGGLDG